MKYITYERGENSILFKTKLQKNIVTYLSIGFVIGFIHFISFISVLQRNPDIWNKIVIIVDIFILIMFPIFARIVIHMNFQKPRIAEKRTKRLLTPSQWVDFLVQKQNFIQSGYSASKQSTSVILALFISFLATGVSLSSVLTYLVDEPEPIAWLVFSLTILFMFILAAFMILSAYHLVEEYSGRDQIKEIERLINDIIDENIDNSNEIRQRYREIIAPYQEYK